MCDKYRKFYHGCVFRRKLPRFFVYCLPIIILYVIILKCGFFYLEVLYYLRLRVLSKLPKQKLSKLLLGQCYNYVTLYYKVKTFPVKAEKIINAYAASFFPSVCFSEKHQAKISGA